jgi:hypothetical protein
MYDPAKIFFVQLRLLLLLLYYYYRTLTFSFSSLDCLYMSYFTRVRSTLQYASVVWNFITTTDANKLERIQQMFSALSYNRFLPHVHYSYAKALEYLKLHTLRKRRYRLDALFLIQVYRGIKYCPSLLEAIDRPSSLYSVSQRLFYVQFQFFTEKLSFCKMCISC